MFSPHHQFIHRFAAVVACDGLVKRVQQPLDSVTPRTVGRQERQFKFLAILQPRLRRFNVVSDVVIDGQRNRFCTTVTPSERTKQVDKKYPAL